MSLRSSVENFSVELKKRVDRACSRRLSQTQESFGEADASSIIQELIAPQLVPQMLQAVSERFVGTQGENTHFSLAEGVYAQVSIYRTEPALGDQVMKNDHWDGIHLLKDLPAIEGAPNFRRIPGTILFGVGQPSYDGYVNVLKVITSDEPQHLDIMTGNKKGRDISALGDAPADLRPNDNSSEIQISLPKDTATYVPFNKIYWINLREEPVNYINGSPYAPRDRDTLNINLEHLLGIEGMDLELMEQRMKADIITKSWKQGGEFEYVSQDQGMNNFTKKVKIEEGRVLTPVELIEVLKKKDKFPIEYRRIPITDECAPEEKDFDELVFMLKDLTLLSSSEITPTRAAAVFNCQMGRGRTTTGLVCAYLIMYTHTTHLKETILQDFNEEQLNFDPMMPNYKRGEFSVIVKLISILQNGPMLKYQVDNAIDACGQVQNLREAIVDCRDMYLKNDSNSAKFYARGLNYLERYWWLIVFNAYLAEQAPNAFKMTFSSWMKSRWGLRRLLKKLSLD